MPPVKKEKLPAKWSVGTLHQDAASTPDEIVLNKSAFQEYIILKLESGDQSEIQRLRGLKPWALFDLENRAAWLILTGMYYRCEITRLFQRKRLKTLPAKDLKKRKIF